MSLAPVITLVLWLTCLCVGALGLVLPYDRPHALAKTLEPVRTEILNADISDELAPPQPQTVTPPDPLQPPPPPDAMVPPDAPPLIPVAKPEAVAFALPVEAPTRVVEPRHASHARVTPQPTAPARPAVQQLVMGRGAGSHIHPEYPHEALEQRQEGRVGIEFTVGAGGEVTAEATAPSRWPMLNQAALRAVRGAHLPPGPYRITINFQIR